MGIASSQRQRRPKSATPLADGIINLDHTDVVGDDGAVNLTGIRPTVGDTMTPLEALKSLHGQVRLSLWPLSTCCDKRYVFVNREARRCRPFWE